MINRPIINQIQELDIPKKYFQGLTPFFKNRSTVARGGIY